MKQKNIILKKPIVNTIIETNLIGYSLERREFNSYCKK